MARVGRSRRRPASRLAAAACSFLLAPSIASAFTFTEAPPANLDFSSLGQVGIVGDFNGISLYEYEQQNGISKAPSGVESLLAQLPNGALASVISTDASIRAMCTFVMSDGKPQGVVLGGNFTSIDGTKTTAVGLFNPETSQVTPLDGIEGEVNALLCDKDSSTVYVGGTFRGGNSTNAIAWVGTQGWTNLPFAGFNGPVNSITKAPNGHIIFGGSFTGIGNGSAPSQPDGQSINLSTANVSAINSATTNGFSDPQNIVCSDGSDKAGSTWLVQDNTPGFWDAAFGFGFVPTKLRLWNTHIDGRGTKSFRMIAFPDTGIMNLTYVDPATGRTESCTSACPLSNDPSIKYQDFHLVNYVGMNRFQIAIYGWYGRGAGLAGIQVFQDNIFAYAVQAFNEPKCGDVSYPSSATATGPWKESPSLQSNSRYLRADIPSNVSPKSASIVFTPNIRESGNYSVNIYTPGCAPENTCQSRGRVNITGVMAPGSSTTQFTTSLFQTNNFDKYDQIYFGYIEKTSDSFKPTITLTPLAGQDMGSQTIVAQRIGFTLLNTTGGLNSLYDFNPRTAEITAASISSSTVNKLGSSLNSASAVKSLLTDGDTVYVAGNFTSEQHNNIVSISNSKDVKNLDSGLNGQVLSMYMDEKLLYVGGDFTNNRNGDKSGASHVATYNPDTDDWSPLGNGVNGVVNYIVPFKLNVTDKGPETVITLSGAFTECKAFGDAPAIPTDGFAVWVPSRKNWLQNLGLAEPSFSGMLTAAILNAPGGSPIYAGSVISSQLAINSAATLGDDGLGQFAVKVNPSPMSSSRRRRDTLSDSDVFGAVTGKFYTEDKNNITILAGHFSAKDSKGATINNLALIDGKNKDAISGLGEDISSDSRFLSVDVSGSTLFAGGSVSGSVNGNKVSGLIKYDLGSRSFPSQPAPITGKNQTVSVVTVQPDSAMVYVGGSFDTAGALDCPGLCTYDSTANQWQRPGDGFGGRVHALLWSSKTDLLVAGDLTFSGSNTSLVIYHSKDESWSSFPNSQDLPGPVEVLTAASDDVKQLWASGVSSKDGSVFLMKYDGSNWSQVQPTLDRQTIIRGLQVFSTTKSHDKSDLVDKKEVLMLTGSIVIPNFGTASAVLFNGTTFQPYALTTGSLNGAGSIARVFTQKDNFFTAHRKHMPLVFVVLIGLAIALALVLIIVLAGIVLDRLRKRREGYTPAPTSMYDRGTGIQRIPPRELFQSLGKGRPTAPQI